MKPEQLNELPEYVQSFYEGLVDGSSSEVKHYLAWQEVKRRFDREGDRLVANAENFVTLDRVPMTDGDGGFTVFTNSASGGVVLNAVLADTSPRKSDGRFYTEQDLRAMAKRINEGGIANPVGDDRHEEFQRAAFMNSYKPGLVKRYLEKSRGLIEDVTAKVKDGKLWVQAFLEDRYEDLINKYDSVSVETLGFSDRSGRIRDPYPLGFIFTDEPQLEGAKIQNK